MKAKVFYDTRMCINLIKKKYWYVPRWIIKRVLFAEELYMHKQGIIDWTPDWSYWKDN